MAQPEVVKDIEARVKIAGDTMTGNLKGQWFQGTWLQTSQTADLGKSPSRIAVIRDDGWLYYRTPSELASDIGLTGNYVLKSGDTMTGNLTAPKFIGSLQGNADTATKLSSARTITLTGAITGSGTFDGSKNLSITTTLSSTGNYLPLSGGTLTGDLLLNTGIKISLNGNRGSILWGTPGTTTGIYSSGYACGGKQGLCISQGADETSGIQFNGDYISMWSPCDSYSLRYYDEDGGNEIWYIDGSGNSYFNKSYNAVWNDYAEFRESNKEYQPGYVLSENGDDTLSISKRRLDSFAGVISDTFGFAEGETEKAKTPIAVAGRVLVYTYQDREKYSPGDCVCTAPDGTVDIMTRDEIIKYPDRIVGIVSCVPNYETWGTGNVKVDGRIWIRIK